MQDVLTFLAFWAKHHPFTIGAVVVGFFVVTWLLNRKSAADREAERVVKGLVEASKDKYKDVRPLR
jgi:hypothetical protein